MSYTYQRPATVYGRSYGRGVFRSKFLSKFPRAQLKISKIEGVIADREPGPLSPRPGTVRAQLPYKTRYQSLKA